MRKYVPFFLSLSLSLFGFIFVDAHRFSSIHTFLFSSMHFHSENSERKEEKGIILLLLLMDDSLLLLSQWCYFDVSYY